MTFWTKVSIALLALLPLARAEDSVSITQGPDWRPIENLRTIQAGSVLDFSFLSKGPAGQYGKLVVRNGQFEFEKQPGQRVKFFGPNLCYDLNFPSKEDAPKLAELLVRMGYNVVRLIQFDLALMPDYKKGLDPEKLDRIEYFFWCLKQRGIHIVTDLHSSRSFAAEECPEFGKPFCREIVFLNNVYPSARRAWERFARALLTHRNPYTKLTWAEDPALVGICPVNEDFVYHGLPASELFAKPYAEWLKVKKLTVENDGQNAAAYVRFQTEIQQDTYNYYKKFLDSLGVQALMTGANNVEYKIQTLIRQRLDFVDNHAYWNHPDFYPESPWGLPWKQPVTVSELSRSSGIHRIFGPCRIMNKPFTMTEFNYCYPNFYRGEGGALMGAYAAFQSWDGLFRFDFGHDADILSEERPAYVFGAIYDPINRLTEKMIALLFLRGDVAQARKKIPYLLTEGVAYNTYRPNGDYFPDNVRMLALCVRIGSLDATDQSRVKGKYPVAIVPAADSSKFAGTKVYKDDSSLISRLLADNVLDPKRCNESKGQYLSDTGELSLDAQNRLFKAVTPRSEAFIFEKAGTQTGGCVKVENLGGACTVLVSAVDDQSIRSSRRLLVLHLTDVQNDQVKFNQAMDTWQEQGKLPHLVRRGSARISVRLDATKGIRVWAVDLSGVRKEPIDFTSVGRTISFTADTVRPKGTYLAYEIEVSEVQ